MLGNLTPLKGIEKLSQVTLGDAFLACPSWHAKTIHKI